MYTPLPNVLNFGVVGLFCTFLRKLRRKNKLVDFRGWSVGVRISGGIRTLDGFSVSWKAPNRRDYCPWRRNHYTIYSRKPNYARTGLLGRGKGHTHKGHGEKVLKVMNFRVFSRCFQGIFRGLREFQGIFRVFSGCFQGVFPYALSGYALWILPKYMKVTNSHTQHREKNCNCTIKNSTNHYITYE